MKLLPSLWPPNAIAILVLTATPALAQPTPVQTLDDFDQPFLFAYGTWKKKPAIANGLALLNGITNAGGAGHLLPLDLSGKSELSPAVRLKIGPNNQAKTLRVLLLDSQERSATWNFSLEGVPVGEMKLLTPQEGATLGVPSDTGKPDQMPDLSKIANLQLQGDWDGNKPLDVEVDAIVLVRPDAAMIAQRAQRTTRLAQEATAKKREQDALKAKYLQRTKLSPRVVNLSLVAPDVLAITIESGHIAPGTLEAYLPQAGDSTKEKKRDDGKLESVQLVRAGKTLGYLLPTWAAKREWLQRGETFEGDPLLGFEADKIANFTVSSPDDAAFKTPQKPFSIGRKSRATNWSRDADAFEMRHSIYLKLPTPLTAGKHYTIALGDLNTQQTSVEFDDDASKVRSEAVHVNQIGYRPDDPIKTAFVSCWLGTGGNLALPATLKFSLVDAKSGQMVFSGTSDNHWPASKPELMQNDENFNATDVARLDFSRFQTPGRYRVVVEGIGSSYSFEIGPDVWRNAFTIQMRGLLNNRSGVVLGPPYTTFQKPPDMVPANGYEVFKTNYRAVESGGENYAAIKAGSTGEKMPQAWGGYHDAGDWNPRRVTHMKVNMASLELFDLFPNYFAALKLNLPPTPNLDAKVPDVLSEAIWEFGTFQRLQQADGGVGYGIETGDGDPLPGEVSWLQSMPAFVLNADYASSWYYAATGARLSRLLQPYDAKMAQGIRDSAVRAFAFAETDFARDKVAGETAKRDNTWAELDNRNLAAVELYWATRDQKYHDIFLQDTVLQDAKPDLFAWGKHVQREQAFVYARLPKGLGDETLKQKAVVATQQMAERALKYAANNAFNLTTPDKGKPQFIGFYSTPDAFDLTRAHFLTGDVKYLTGAVQATQFQSGDNPNNLVYTSGLGANPIRHPFHLDSRLTGQEAPAGLTPYGNIDFKRWNNGGITWPITWYLSKNTVPSPYEWPTNEAYWDLGQWPMLEEFTVDAWAPNVQVWGYLAARAALKP